MKALNTKVAITILGVMLAVGVPTAWAQSAGGGHHVSAAAPATPHGSEAARDGAMPMDMCRQMMAGGMPGMGGDQKMDPKMMAHMLQMRGEMMKAMGDVMMKHGKMMMSPDGPSK
jgi:hypothetical protein